MAEQERTERKEEDAAGQTEAARHVNTIPATGSADQDVRQAETASEPGMAAGGAQGGMSRMISGVERTAGETVSGVRNTASSALRSVGTVGGDVIGVTRDVLKDAIAATEDVGTDLVGGVRNVAKEVVVGVGDVGESAVQTAAHLLAGIVGGVKTVVGEALPRGGARTERAPVGQEAQYRRAERPAERTTMEEAVH